MRVGEGFEAEYPDASALATECYVNLCHAGDLLMELHNRQTREDYGLSPGAREVLAIVDGAGEPLEPAVIAQRLLITTASITTLLDTLEKRRLVRRITHPDDRRKRLVVLMPEAERIVDEYVPAFHARERAVVSDALTAAEQRELLRLVAKVQQAAVRAGSRPPGRGARRVRRVRPVRTPGT